MIDLAYDRLVPRRLSVELGHNGLASELKSGEIARAYFEEDRKTPTGLARDPPLAAYGEKQANELAEHFFSLPESDRPTLIVSSPFYRCLQTAKPVAIKLGLPIFVDHGLSEWYSPAKPGTGLHPRPARADELQKLVPQIDSSWSTLYYPTRRGELVDTVHDRAGEFLDMLHLRLQHWDDAQHTKILLVSHAATVIALTRELLNDRELPLRIGCCSLSVLNRKDPEGVRGSYEAVMLNSGSHLVEGASRDWGFEDIQLGPSGEVIEDIGEPGTKLEDDFPVGPQLQEGELAAKM